MLKLCKFLYTRSMEGRKTVMKMSTPVLLKCLCFEEALPDPVQMLLTYHWQSNLSGFVFSVAFIIVLLWITVVLKTLLVFS